MQPKARMTIRIEQPAKPKLPTTPFGHAIVSKEKLDDPYDEAIETEFTTLNSPYQDDIHALEEIIRKTETVNWNMPSVPSIRVTSVPSLPIPSVPVTNRDRSVPSGPSYDEPDEGRWSVVLPEDEEEAESAGGNGWYNRAMHSREENGPSWGRVFLSVAAAVGTGALFGYIVLSLFTGEPLFPGKPNEVNSPSIQASSEPNLAPTVKEPSTTGVSGSTESTNPVKGEVSGENASASVQIDGDIYYMLQYGVFQNEDSMETAVGQLRDKGYASASEIKDGYRVYVGMARSRDEAELLATQIRDTEIYIKPLGGEPITVSSDMLSAGGAEFMNASGSLMRKLAQYSGNGLLEKQPQALEATDQAALQEAQRLWQGAQASIDQMGGSAAEDARALVLALNSALGSMTEFNQEPSRFHLWNVQSAVMKALISDQELRTAIQPSVVG